MALGRRAGNAVVRNRARRVARDEFGMAHTEFLGVDFLLAARSDVSNVPRRQVRKVLGGLFRRAHEALAGHPARLD